MSFLQAISLAIVQGLTEFFADFFFWSFNNYPENVSDGSAGFIFDTGF